MELPAAGGNRGLVQQSPVQGEGRLSARHNAEEDSLSHLAFAQRESYKTQDEESNRNHSSLLSTVMSCLHLVYEWQCKQGLQLTP